MPTIDAAEAAIIPAPPAAVYAILADYHERHPRILPESFRNLRVLAGGHGAGTVFQVTMEVLGTRRTYRLTVTEPEPGRVLVESDPAAGLTTTFTLTPAGEGRATHLRIATTSSASPGLAGRIERLLSPPIMRRIYRAELARLAAYVGVNRA
ncbi:MAG TPA: SRPBCC family protein [Chloroflexia bacterium]|nr:SRPBCC family protein [Chloroflexia bacterium]